MRMKSLKCDVIYKVSDMELCTNWHISSRLRAHYVLVITPESGRGTGRLITRTCMTQNIMGIAIHKLITTNT